MGGTDQQREAVLQQLEWETHPQGVLLWVLALQLKNEQGRVLEWRDRRFLIDILCDLPRLLVIMKCSQVGVSTIEILKSYFLAQVLRRRIIYSLPTDKLVQDFNTTKLEPMQRYNPLIRPTETDNQSSKAWDRAGFVLLRGTMGESQDVMVTADYIIADEVNHSNIAVIEGLESRLQSDDSMKGQWWFGHPTFPGVGVDAKWKDSDRREWHVTCRACGEEQPLDFWQNICRERRIYVCRSCDHEVTDDDRRAGRWLPTNPGARWTGYHISHMCAPWITADEILEAEKKPKDYFFSKVLGLPHVGGSGSVDTALLRQANIWPVPPEMQQPKQKFIGVDVGGPLHVVIGNEHGITKGLLLSDEPGKEGSKWTALDRLMVLERPTLLVIDNAPSGKDQTAFQKRHPHKVLRCIYDYTKDSDKRKADWVQDREQGTINAHRTRLIDGALTAFANGELPILMDPEDEFFDGKTHGTTGKVENCLVQHWGTLYQAGGDGQDVNVVKKDRGGNVIRTWENSGPDHFAHASLYYKLAREAGRHLDIGTARNILPGGTSKARRRPGEEDDDDDRPKRRGYF